MKIQILSDIHVEFHRDNGRSFVRTLDPDVADVLCIAGDAGTGRLAGGLLKLIADTYAPKPVLYVPGNHEYYDSSFKVTDRYLRGLGDKIANLQVLNCNGTKIKGVKVIGAPLWFPNRPRNTLFEKGLADFDMISNFRNEVYSMNVQQQEYLRRNMTRGCVVITHHAPSYYSVSERYLSSEINRFYVCPMEELILQKHPTLWIHGHMHSTVDYMVGDCRITANPYGYYCAEVNREFDPNRVVEV